MIDDIEDEEEGIALATDAMVFEEEVDDDKEVLFALEQAVNPLSEQVRLPRMRLALFTKSQVSGM